MNISVEDIFMVIMAFLFGLFLRKEMACGLVEGADDDPPNDPVDDNDLANDPDKLGCYPTLNEMYTGETQTEDTCALVIDRVHDDKVENACNGWSGCEWRANSKFMIRLEKCGQRQRSVQRDIDIAAPTAKADVWYEQCSSGAPLTKTCPTECEAIRQTFCNKNVVAKKDLYEHYKCQYVSLDYPDDKYTPWTSFNTMCEKECVDLKKTIDPGFIWYNLK